MSISTSTGHALIEALVAGGMDRLTAQHALQAARDDVHAHDDSGIRMLLDDNRASGILSDLFVWDRSSQGFDFWEREHGLLQAQERRKEQGGTQASTGA